MLLLIILFLFSNLWSAADQPSQSSLLTHNRKWPKITKDKASIIYPCTEKLPQNKKNQSLIEAIGLYSDDIYGQQRIYIAALVYAGADVREAQQTEKRLSLLHHVAKFDDISLARLLFKYKADVNEKEDGRTAIFSALSIAFATELMNQAQFKRPDEKQKIELMNTVMLPKYAPELITLYQEQLKCDPTSCDSLGNTPLIHLAHWPQKSMIKKAVLLFAHLSHEQIQKQITHKNSERKTVLKVTKAKMKKLKKDSSVKEEFDELNNFHSFLRQIAKRNYAVLKLPPNDQLQSEEVEEHNRYDDSELEEELLDLY